MRHQRDELRLDREMREVRHLDARVAELREDPCHLLVRQLQEVLKPAELFHHSQRRGMDRVAAKIAEEILVLLEHRYLDAGACQKHAKHHSRWATARNATRDPLIHEISLD